MLVIVQGATLVGGMQTLSFGVDPGRQDAVCSLPVTLDVEPLHCTPGTFGPQSLEGCKALPRAHGLALGDGKCDSIHLYWNHARQQVWWWRS